LNIVEDPADDWLTLPPAEAPPPAIGQVEMGRLARNWAKNTNLPVFACQSDKKPATPHGFKDASRDPGIIARMFTIRSAALIGIPTGAVSGLSVLDIDVKHQAAAAWLKAAEPRLPATLTYATRSGGVHIWFHHADGIKNTESKLARGVDTRGDGGYILLWFAAGYECYDPSLPAPWPDWLRDALLRKPEPVRVLPARQGYRPRYASTGAPERMISRAVARVASAADGHRHPTLRAAACTIGGLLDRVDLSRGEAARMLLDAARDGGAVDLGNASRTIEWGLTRGAQSPLTVGGAR
jgi:hypothetical protein